VHHDLLNVVAPPLINGSEGVLWLMGYWARFSGNNSNNNDSAGTRQGGASRRK
jgi:hypothetical protein